MKGIGLLLSVLLFWSSSGIAQDPGEPDEIIVGNLDGSPIYAVLGSVVDIPVWVKTDEDIDAFFIPVATEDEFVSDRLGGSILPPLSAWEITEFLSVYSDTPEQGYTSQGLLGMCYIMSPPCNTPLNTEGAYTEIVQFTVQISSDPSIIGQSTQIIPGYDDLNGPLVFCLGGGVCWPPEFTGGTIEIVQDIPTLSEWGMLIMGLLLLALGTVAVVRKRKAILNRVS